jgi:hypothetical protein
MKSEETSLPAVRCIVWLGLFVGQRTIFLARVPELIAHEETQKQPEPHSTEYHREGLQLEMLKAIKAMRLEEKQRVTRRGKYSGDATADSRVAKPARSSAPPGRERERDEPDAHESDERQAKSDRDSLPGTKENRETDKRKGDRDKGDASPKEVRLDARHRPNETQDQRPRE